MTVSAVFFLFVQNCMSEDLFGQTGYQFENAPLFSGIDYRIDLPDSMSGVGFHGSLPAGFSYQLQYGTIDKPVISRFLNVISNEPDITISNVDVDYAYAGSLEWDTPLEGIKLGGSMCNLRMEADTNMNNDLRLPDIPGIDEGPGVYTFNSIRTSVASTRHLTGNLELTAEYIQHRAIAKYADAFSKNKVGEGYFGGAKYQFTDRIELGSYYFIYYADKDDKHGRELAAQGKTAAKAWIKDLALTTRIDINDNWVFMMEGHLMEGLAGVENFTEEEWMRFAAEMKISF